MMNLENFQTQINELYVESFKSYKGGLNLSVPLIPRISKAFVENRVVIVGQETNTWFRSDEKVETDDLKNIFLNDLSNLEKICLIKRYDNFIENNVSSYGGNFWKFQRSLYENKILGESMVNNHELNHCWINMFSVEACRTKGDHLGRPTRNKMLAKKVIQIQKHLLFKTLMKLEPKLIIFLTGKPLDNYLKSYGINDGGCKWKNLDRNEIFTNDHLAEIQIVDVQNPLYNSKIIRGYHPSYFMGYINANKNFKRKLERLNINDTPAGYYTKLVKLHINRLYQTVQ